MENTKSVLKTSTKIIVIAIIILILIFLSFLMVSIVPKILSSVANTTVSITSAFFPAEDKKGTTSGITLNGSTTSATGTTTPTDGTSTKVDFLSNFFGPRKTDNSNDQSVNFSVATSTKQGNVNESNKVSNVPNKNYVAHSGTPDLSVQIISVGSNVNGIFVAKNNFTTTDTVIVNFQVTNWGTSPSGVWNIRVDSPSSNTNDQVKTIIAKSLPAGTAVTGQVVFNTPAIGTNQKITISVDPNGLILESNESNNQVSATVNITPIYSNYSNTCVNGYINGVYTNCSNYSYNTCVNGYMNGVYTNCNNYNSNLPNLSINFISLGKIDVYNQFTQTSYLRTSDKAAIKFSVTNNSPTYTSSWSWKANLVGPNPYYTGNYYNSYNTNGYTYNNDGSRTYISPIIESGLAPGETRTYTAAFDGLTYGSNYMTIIVDSANNITESNEGDNSISQSFFVNY